MNLSRSAVTAVVLLNSVVPLTLLGWDAWRGRLGANPVNFAIRTTGLLALIFLLLTLAVTPAIRLSGWGWLGPARRVLGLCAFFHTALHFLIFFGFDRAASVGATLSEIAMRPYLMVGVVGLVLMVPLAATSTDGMIKRLGPKRWKTLHRLAYVAAAAGTLHFYMLVKADILWPLVCAAVLTVLLGYRLVAHYLQLRSDAKQFRSGPAPGVSAVPAAKPKFWTGQLRVARVFDETPEVRTFRLASATGTRLPFDYLPGQYLNLTLVVDGKKIRRSYTIASSPTRTGHCELTVKREEHGMSSRHLHDAIREGSLLDVSAPAGRFTFTGAEADSVVLIAGGVGITPLMAKIRYLTDLSWPGDIYLVYSAKTERDIIFRDELDYLRRRFPNLHVTVTLTRTDGANGTWTRGRISPELLTQAVPRIATRPVHVCGPSAMTEPTRQMLRDLGVPAARIQFESFTSAARLDPNAPPASEEPATNLGMPDSLAAAAAADTGVASVTFARSGKTTPMAATKTVLEAAEDLGVAIAYDCRAGICGTCKTKLLAGHVTMDAADALEPVDRANNVILGCQARCVDQVVVDV